MPRNTRPFTETLPRLLEEREWSLRELARRCQAEFDGWGSAGTLSYYQQGKIIPTMKALDRIAYALRVDPAVFPEYRLHLARHQLDPGKVGLAVALDNLRRFERQSEEKPGSEDSGLSST